MKKKKFVQRNKLRTAITDVIRTPIPWIKVPAISLFVLFIWAIGAAFYTGSTWVENKFGHANILPWWINLPIILIILWGFMTETYTKGLREILWEIPVAYQRHIKEDGGKAISGWWVRNMMHLFFTSWVSLLIIWVYYLRPMTPDELEMGIFTTILPGFYWFLGIFVLLKIGERTVFVRQIILKTRILYPLALLCFPFFCGFMIWLFGTYPYAVPP